MLPAISAAVPGPYTRGILALVLTTLVWGSTFPLTKNALADLSPAALVAARFLVAAIAFSPFLRGGRRLWQAALPLGIVLFLSFITQVIGLQTTSSNRAAFVTGLNVVLVPLLGPLLARAVPRAAWPTALAAFAGVGIMSWEGGALVIGDLWVLGCAISYAAYILMLERIAPTQDPLALTAAQLAVVAALGLTWAAPELLASGLPAGLEASLPAIVYLGLAATALATLAQAWAQQRVPAVQTALVYALEPVFAAAFALWLLGETLGPRGLAGAALVVAATVWGQRSSAPSTA